MKRQDTGAALALVIFFITFLALWMSAVAFLTQSATSAIGANSRLSQARAEVVTSTLQQAIVALTNNGLGQDGRFGMDFDGRRCDQAGSPLPSTFDTQINGQKVTVRVTCTQKTFSGYQFPLASFMLTGSSCPAGQTCVTGQDGGLKLTQPCSGGVRMQVTGGLLNVSGAWSNVSDCNLELLQSGENPPLITQPDPGIAAECPANNWDVASCQCPSWFPINGKEWCPAGNTFSDINPENPQSPNFYFIDNVVSGLGTVDNRLARIVGTCGPIPDPADPKKTIYDVNRNAWGSSVNITPGIINKNVLKDINTLLKSGTACGDGSSDASPAILFTPGIYKFDLCYGILTACTSANLPKDTSLATGNTLFMNDVVNVVAGEATSATDCDPTRPGAEFQFVGSTFFELQKGSFTICPNRIARGEIGTTMVALTSSWNGARGSTNAFIKIPGGVNVQFKSLGMVLAPAGWADVTIGGSTATTFYSGAVFKAMSVKIVGSAQVSPNMLPPPPFNGDRIVQLRLWDETNNRDLGLVQLIIKDYFSKRPGYGYKVVAWRTMW